MPLAWQYSVVAFDSDGSGPWAADTVEVVFIERTKMLSPRPGDTGWPQPEEITSPAWLVMAPRFSREYWFETQKGLFTSKSPQTYGHLLLPSNPQQGMTWSLHTDVHAHISAVRDTVIGSTEYRIVEVVEESERGERNVYGWEIGTGLIYYSTNLPQHNQYLGLGISRVEYCLARVIRRP
jgi:hypothetical protein